MCCVQLLSAMRAGGELNCFVPCSTKSAERRLIMMAKDYNGTTSPSELRRSAGHSVRRSARPRHDTSRDPECGYAGGGWTKERPPPEIGAVCQCSLLIVPEELERQWQAELRRTDLRYQIVLTKSNVRALKIHHELDESITDSFPMPWDVASLDVVVTTMERMGSRAGKRDGTSQNDGMQKMADGLALVHWARIIIDEGHELGGRGLSEMTAVLGAVLASATWVLSATPDRAGGGHFRQVRRPLIFIYLYHTGIRSDLSVRYGDWQITRLASDLPVSVLLG